MCYRDYAAGLLGYQMPTFIYFPNCLFFGPSLSYDLCLSWHQPSGCRAKCWVSEEGHPLSVVFWTNTAATFPLLYPSVGFGPLYGATEQIWPSFSKNVCTAARPLYTTLERVWSAAVKCGNGNQIQGSGQSKDRGEVSPTVFTYLTFPWGEKYFPIGMAGNTERNDTDIYFESAVNEEGSTVGSKLCRPYNSHLVHVSCLLTLLLSLGNQKHTL